MPSPLHTLTHVASQLMARWLPPPEPSPLFDTALAAFDWEDLYVHMRDTAPGVLPWLLDYTRTLDPGARMLLHTVRTHLEAVSDQGATYLTCDDPRYPAYLRLTRDPPLALTILGDLDLLNRPAVSVVGSRKASALAIRESFRVGQLLAEQGYMVVSGGAFGCDIAAHHGVLASHRPEAAACVFAGGLERLYPTGNKRIFDKIRTQRGLLISERLWSASSLPHDFPARNRIIAGLSSTTLVMQAAERSGALITARLALEEGREVMALIHPEGDIRAGGTATLIADGASSFESGATLLKG